MASGKKVCENPNHNRKKSGLGGPVISATPRSLKNRRVAVLNGWAKSKMLFPE
jgi:hypothetical protein